MIFSKLDLRSWSRENPLKVPLFEDRLSLLTDTGIAGEGVRSGCKPVILSFQFEDRRADLNWQEFLLQFGLSQEIRLHGLLYWRICAFCRKARDKFHQLIRPCCV